MGINGDKSRKFNKGRVRKVLMHIKMFFKNNVCGCDISSIWKICLFAFVSTVLADDVNEGGDLSIPKRK